MEDVVEPVEVGVLDVVGKPIAEIQSVAPKYDDFRATTFDLAKFDMELTGKLLPFFERVVEEWDELVLTRPAAPKSWQDSAERRRTG